MTSAGVSSMPGALLIFWYLIAASISSNIGGSMFTLCSIKIFVSSGTWVVFERWRSPSNASWHSSANQSFFRCRESYPTISSAVVLIARFTSHLVSSIGFPVGFKRIWPNHSSSFVLFTPIIIINHFLPPNVNFSKWVSYFSAGLWNSAPAQTFYHFFSVKAINLEKSSIRKVLTVELTIQVLAGLFPCFNQ